MHNVTPISGMVGGAIIGLATALLMLLTGRIAGISGVFASMLSPDAPDRSWRVAFVAGLIAAPFLGLLVGSPLPRPTMPVNLVLVIVSGFLVGLGSRLGGGCTSGHGVCGIARLSPRSLVFTAIFMVTAIATVAFTRHVIGG
ncbi:YeeE/YedE family protein [Bradyrhizobium sp. USDA 313]|uniref:YeeE/YedE family protein n=1 Tax=Bradyrhizobium sp. USDA 313 TaxID=3156307 RepID=UPI0035169117